MKTIQFVKIILLLLFITFFNYHCDGNQEKSEKIKKKDNNKENKNPFSTENLNKTKPLIYFVGNSLTYVNDIPSKVIQLLQHNNLSKGGYSGKISTLQGARNLTYFLNDYIPNVFLKLPKYIVLQDQSSGLESNDSYDVLSYYINSAAEIGSKVVFYQTWVAFNPHASCSLHSGIDEKHGKQAKSAPQLYIQAARDYGVSVAPVAEAFTIACNSSLDKSLVPNNDHHQLINGAYVAAYTFGYTLFPQQTKLKLLNDSSVSSGDMIKLNDAAFNAVKNQGQSKLKVIGTVKDEIGGTIETATVISTKSIFKIEDTINYGDVDMFYLETTENSQKIKIELVSKLQYIPNTVSLDDRIFIFNQSGKLIESSILYKKSKFEITTTNQKIYIALISSKVFVARDYFGKNNEKYRGYTLNVEKVK